MARFSLLDFLKNFPTDRACLDYIQNLRYPLGSPCPKCKRPTNFFKVRARACYACQFCGGHVFPLAGTIFEKSTTPPRLWLYALFLLSQTRSGVSAKQLERELGVTYKTAWRIAHSIRKLMREPGVKDRSFRSHLNLGIAGVYRTVSNKYFKTYEDEFFFRSKYGKNEDLFGILLKRAVGGKIE